MTDTTFYGHPHFDTASVEAAVQADITSAAKLDGEFAVATRSSGGTALFCSGVGVTQLFYAIGDGKFHYGDTVSDVVEAAGFDWIWDYDALTNLAVFGHLIGKQTLHPAVSRLGKGELVKWNGSGISSETYVVDQNMSSNPVDEAIDALLDTVNSQSKPGDVISVSAGFDSRVILAAFLSLGLKPNLVVMGAENSTDVLVASQIAKTFNLPLEHVPVSGIRGLSDRFLITRLTSGTKTIENWHTYEYTAGASSPAGSGIWIGSNGEFARTFFIDRGLQFYAANAIGAPMVKKFWQTKISRNSLPEAMRPALTDEFLECLSSEKQLAQLQSFFPGGSLAEINDHLYLERVRQFIANGLRLVSTKYTPKTPFLDPRWIAAVQRMPRRWKLGNRWHRHAIGRLFPKLLAFPYDSSGVAMGNPPGLKYWLGFAPHSNSVPFFDYPAFVKSKEFRQVYASSIKALRGLFRNDESHQLLNDWPLRTTTYFAALSFYCEMLREHGTMRMRVTHG